MKCLWGTFRNVDILSPTIGFEYEGSNHYKSYVGAAYSALLIITAGVITLLFGQDFYLRQNPSVVTSQVMIKNSTVQIDNKDTVIVVGLLENNAFSESAILKYDIELVQVYAYINDQGLLALNRTVYHSPLVKCNTLNLNLSSTIDSIFEFRNSIGVYCISYDNLTFANGFSEIPSTFLNLKFSRCKNCPIVSPGGDYVTLWVLDSYADHSNYTTPIQYKLNGMTYQIYDGILKRIFYRIIRNIYNSDNGWILNDPQSISYLSVKDTGSDFVLSSTSSTSAYPLLWVTFESPRLVFSTLRTYLKIQDFSANAGGFITSLMIVIDMLTRSHLRYLYLIFLRNLVLDLDKDMIIIEENVSPSNIKNNICFGPYDKLPNTIIPARLQSSKSALNNNGYSDPMNSQYEAEYRIKTNNFFVNNKFHQIVLFLIILIVEYKQERDP